MSGSWQAERGSRRTRRLPREERKSARMSVSVPWNLSFIVVSVQNVADHLLDDTNSRRDQSPDVDRVYVGRRGGLADLAGALM